jgi:hypothetical protein
VLAAQLPLLQPPVQTQDQGPAGVLRKSLLLSSIAPRLWLHMQKHVPCKQATPLQSFVATGVQSMPPSDDILEEACQATRHNRRSRPNSVGSDRGGSSNVGQNLECCPAATAACDELLPERQWPPLGPSWRLMMTNYSSMPSVSRMQISSPSAAPVFRNANLPEPKVYLSPHAYGTNHLSAFAQTLLRSIAPRSAELSTRRGLRRVYAA